MLAAITSIQCATFSKDNLWTFENTGSVENVMLLSTTAFRSLSTTDFVFIYASFEPKADLHIGGIN